MFEIMNALSGDLFPSGILDTGDLRIIETNADRILAEVGIEVGDIALAQELWHETGAWAADSRIYLPEGLAREIVTRHAQGQFTQLGRTEHSDILFGNGSLMATPAYGPPYIGRGGKRRPGTLADFREILTTVDRTAVLRHAGGLIGDIAGVPQSTRHLHQVAAMLELCSKPILGPAPNSAAYRDALELAKIARPPQPDVVHLLNLVNANSPLRYRKGMFRALVETARLRQGLLLTSYCLPGLTAPVTTAGALTQGLAEILFGAATAFLIDQKAKIIAGIIPIPFSMGSMRPTYGQPSTLLSANVGAQLVRRLGLPCRIDGGPSSSKVCDAQAGYEASFGLRTAVDARADIIVHAAGWLDNGLLFDFDKYRSDVECLGTLMGSIPTQKSSQPLEPAILREIQRYVDARSNEIGSSPIPYTRSNLRG